MINLISRPARCPICGFHKFKGHDRDNHDVYFISCERCGEFKITADSLREQDMSERISNVGYILSGLARELYETRGTTPIFTTKNFEEYAKNYPVPDINSIEEKIKKLLQRLRKKTEYFGQEIDLGDIETVVPLAYAKNSSELMALFALMTEKKLATIGVTTNSQDDGLRRVKITLSANAWDITNTSRKENTESDRGFIATWFDDSMNASIDEIEKAITDCGFKAICLRHEHFSERIMDKALGEIRQSRFIVADLTGKKESVFFEAGFAHGLGIEIIYIYREHDGEAKSQLEFYMRHYQCYGYRNPSELKEILKNAISARIKLKK